MHAEILSIGDEITSGQLLDTNSQWLSLRLEELGIRVLYHTTVGDELDPLAAVFRQAIERSDVVISTGGLGPTADDLTRPALAKATGRALVLDEEALRAIRELFARRRREMPKQNESQAMFPDGAAMIRNPNGTAPGIDLEVQRPGREPCRVIVLPGVPAEMREMWHDSVGARLRQLGAGNTIIRHKRINCFGAGESQVEAMLPDLIRRGRTPRVGITASQTTIILRITAEGPTDEFCRAAMAPTEAIIRECLGNLVFGEDDDQLQDAVVRLLRSRRQTLSVVEWGTRGLVTEWLDQAAGAEECFAGGLVVSSPAVPRAVLGVEPAAPAAAADEQRRAVRAMAERCRERFGTDWALAVGRFAEPTPTDASPGEAWLALAAADTLVDRSASLGLHPATLRIYAAKQALNFVRLALVEQSG